MPRRKQKKKSTSIERVKGDFDWRTLRKGDEIYIKAGEGPYFDYINDRGELVREWMGNYGRFTVDHVVSDGIHAYDEYGFNMIYMGPYKVMPSGTIMVPHRITKVKRKDIDAKLA